MYIIDCFYAETPRGKYTWTKHNVLSLILFSPPDQILKMKYDIWLSENTEVIEVRQGLIATYIFDTDEADKDG